MAFAIKIPPQATKYARRLAPLARHHYFVVMLLLFSGVAFATYSINETLNTQADAQYRTEQMQATIGTKFNRTTEETVEAVQSLHKSADSASSNNPLPPGRINPFAE